MMNREKFEKFKVSPWTKELPQNKAEDFEVLRQKIENSEIASLYEPLKEIIFQMKESIENEEHQSLLIDDCSGRIPGRILGETINLIKNKEEKKPIPLFFYAGGRIMDDDYKTEHQKELSEYLDKIKSQLGKKTLLVTEYIASGASLQRDAKILKSKNVDFDIAAVAIDYKDYENEIELRKTAFEFLPEDFRIFWGKEHMLPIIYDEEELSGVVKYFHKVKATTEAAKLKYENKGSCIKPWSVEDIKRKNSARKDIEIISKNLALEYFEYMVSK